MKCAVLCNGPSRTSFVSRDGYDFVIGCNIPWTEVDATVVLDEGVVDLWAKKPDIIKCPTYFSEQAWRYTDRIKKRDFFKQYLAHIIKPKYPYHSSGHNAAEVTIKWNQATHIDIYGCDSYFSNIAGRSYTRQYISKGGVTDGNRKYLEGWRKRWREIIDRNPNVTIEFIK